MPKHLETPTKCRILGAKELFDSLEKEGALRGRKGGGISRIAKVFELDRSVVSKVVSKGRERRRFESNSEPRGGYRGDDILRFGEENLDEAEAIIEDNGYEGHDLTPAGLRYEANLPRVSDRTIARHLRKRSIGRYIPITKKEVSKDIAAARVEFAKKMLRNYPSKESFRKIRFSDEFYYGFGIEENRHYIYRKRGIRERTKPDCIRLVNDPRKKGPKRDTE